MFTEEQKKRQFDLIEKARRREARFNSAERKKQDELLMKKTIRDILYPKGIDNTYRIESPRENGNNGNHRKIHPQTAEDEVFVTHFIRENPGCTTGEIIAHKGMNGKKGASWADRILRRLTFKGAVIRTGFGKYITREATDEQ